MTNRLMTYLITGGIKNKFFIHHRFSNKPGDFKVYQVKGHSGINENIHPSDLMVDVCMYNLRKGEVHRLNKHLGSLLNDHLATHEEKDSIPKELTSQAEQLPKSKKEPYIPF